MARVLNGFMNDASGKLGSVVLSRSKALSIAKKYQPKVFNPKTENQQTNRVKFKNLSAFASSLNNTFIPFLYGVAGIQKNKFNKFIQQNQSAIDDHGNIIFNKLTIGNPPGVQPWLASFRYNAFIDQIDIVYNAVKNGTETDFLQTFVSVLGSKTSGADLIASLDLRHVCCSDNGFSWNCYIYDWGQDVEGNELHFEYVFENSYASGMLWLTHINTNVS
jgi:hypothetical protein